MEVVEQYDASRAGTVVCSVDKSDTFPTSSGDVGTMNATEVVSPPVLVVSRPDVQRCASFQGFNGHLLQVGERRERFSDATSMCGVTQWYMHQQLLRLSLTALLHMLGLSG